MLDGLRDIFLDALCYVPKNKRESLVNKWNKECDNVYKIKEALKAEERYKAKERYKAEKGGATDICVGGKEKGGEG